MSNPELLLAVPAVATVAGGFWLLFRRRKNVVAETTDEALAQPANRNDMHDINDCKGPLQWGVTVQPGTNWRCRCSQLWRYESREDWREDRWIRTS